MSATYGAAELRVDAAVDVDADRQPRVAGDRAVDHRQRGLQRNLLDDVAHAEEQVPVELRAGRRVADVEQAPRDRRALGDDLQLEALGRIARRRRAGRCRAASSRRPRAGPKNTFWNSSAPARAIVVSAKSRSALGDVDAGLEHVLAASHPGASTTFISSRRNASIALARNAGCSGSRARAATAPPDDAVVAARRRARASRLTSRG